MKKVLILFLLFLLSAFPQQRSGRFPQGNVSRIYTDIIHMPGSHSNFIYLTFRIPFSTLLFEKNGETYDSHFRVDAELFTDSGSFIDRQIKEKKASTGSFESTISEIVFEEGFLKFELKPGSYKMITQFTDLKSNKEIRRRNVNFRIEDSAKYFQPVITDESEICGNDKFRLVNFEGNIPFNGKKYTLIIPIKDALQEYYIEISNKGRTCYSGFVKPEMPGEASLTTCDNKIYLNTAENGKSISIISVAPGVQIMEGELVISLMNKSKELQQLLKTRVVWYDKPATLQDRETAVRLLKYIDEQETYENKLDVDEEKFDSVFFDYWKQYDPTPLTTFNELMDEYYKRADYAAINFASVNGKTGLESDRAKIYIKYGSPLKIERMSNEKGKVIEVWFYNNQRKYSFIDEKGTGEFNLMKG